MNKLQAVRAKLALMVIRQEGSRSIRGVSRNSGVTIGDIHEIAGCLKGADCNGAGCRIGP